MVQRVEDLLSSNFEIENSPSKVTTFKESRTPVLRTLSDRDDMPLTFFRFCEEDKLYLVNFSNFEDIFIHRE